MASLTSKETGVIARDHEIPESFLKECQDRFGVSGQWEGAGAACRISAPYNPSSIVV